MIKLLVLVGLKELMAHPIRGNWSIVFYCCFLLFVLLFKVFFFLIPMAVDYE